MELEEEKTTKGRWSKSEHMLFLLGVGQYGQDWKNIQRGIKSRSIVQIRSHAQKYFNKEKKRGTASSLFFSGHGKQQMDTYFLFLEQFRLQGNSSDFNYAQQEYLRCRDTLDLPLSPQEDIRIE